MLHFLAAGRQLGHTPAIDDVHGFCAQTLGAAGSIHGHIAAAAHGYGLAFGNGGLAVGQICLHQVGTGQVFIGAVHALQAFAGNAHKAGQACAGSNIHSLVAVFLHQLVNGQHLADHHVGFKIDTQSLQAVDLALHNGLGQTEFGNAVHQHAACHMKGLKHGDLVAQLGQIARAGQAAGACADNGHLVPVGSRGCGLCRGMLAVPVGGKTLQTADAHAFAAFF